MHAVRARIHSLGKRVRLGVGGGGLQVAGSLRGAWNRSIFDDIGEEGHGRLCSRLVSKGVWERSSRKSRREGRRYVEMDFYRVSERKRRERREWKLILCRLSVFPWVTGVPPRLVPRISRPPPLLPLRFILTRNNTRRGASFPLIFRVARWIKRMMNIFFFFSFFPQLELVSRSFPLFLPFSFS